MSEVFFQNHECRSPGGNGMVAEVAFGVKYWPGRIPECCRAESIVIIDEAVHIL